MTRSTTLCSALLFVGCAAPPPAAAPPPSYPALDGSPVWDEDASTAPAAVLDALDAAQEILADRLSTPPGDLSGYQAWADGALRAFLERRHAASTTVEEHLGRLPSGDPRVELLAAIVRARLHDDLAMRLSSMPGPTIPPDDDPDGRVEAAFREMFEGHAGPYAAAARDHYARCVERAPATGVLAGWARRCASASESLEPLARRAPPAPPPAPPPECRGEPSTPPWPPPPEPPPDESTPPVLAVLYPDAAFEGRDRERLLDAARRRLGRLLGVRVLSAGDMRRAEALHAERRITPGAPACGQAPPLSAILATEHRNVVLATLATECGEQLDEAADGATMASDSTPVCWLHVGLRRAGTDDRTGLPMLGEVSVPRDGARVEAWLAALDLLRPGGTDGAVLAMLGSASPRSFALHEVDDDDPWLRVGPTLDARRAELSGCLRGGDPASARLRFTVDERGAPRDVRAELVTAPAAGADALRACLEDVVRATAWPCPRSGAAERVEVLVCLSR